MVNLRSYESNDEKQILDLFNSTFNQNRSIKHWNWKFKNNSAGENIIALGEDNNQIIAQCTLLSSKMKIGDKYCKGGQSIDAMVHGNYRRQGYFEKLSFLSYELGIKQDILFRYSFPSPNSLNGILNKLGGVLVSNIPVYIRVNKVDQFASFILKNSLISTIASSPIHLFLKVLNRQKYNEQKDYKIVEIDSFDKRFDILWDVYKDKVENMTIRDSKFLNWRITNHPDIKYKTFGLMKDNLRGYVIVKIEEKNVRKKYPLKVGNIVDLIALDEQDAQMLLYKAVKYLESEEVDFTTAWMLEHIPYRNILKKMGFIRSKSTIPFAVKDITANQYLVDDIYDETKWYLMPIETDTY